VTGVRPASRQAAVIRAATFNSMGTTVSFRAVEASTYELVPRMEILFAAADARFSLYRADSELSRIAAGGLSLSAASPPVRGMYALALRWRQETGGLFTPHRPDGVLDLNGVVKADTIQAAGRLLQEAGATDWCLNVGGDILACGEQFPGRPWTIGVVDPHHRNELLTQVIAGPGRRAVATSGTAERGEHIWRAGFPPNPTLPRSHPDRFLPRLVQVSVMAEDIVTADVLATAILAGGPASVDPFVARYDIGVLTVDDVGGLRGTPGVGLPGSASTPAARVE
jgi:FAD:protein FMN transferase